MPAADRFAGPIYPDTYQDGPVASRPLSRDGDDPATTKAKHSYLSSMAVRKQRNKDGAVYFITFTCYTTAGHIAACHPSDKAPPGPMYPDTYR